MTKQWQTYQIPLSAGLDTQSDPRSLQPPQFDILKDAEFELDGGIQTRKPFAAKGVNVVGGGTLSNIRRIVDNAGELLCFTRTGLYAWSEAAQAWAFRSTHLATKVEESTRFVTTGDQLNADRAELNGYVVVSWHEVRSGNSYGYVAAYDAVTGAVTMAPRELAGFQRIRLIALSTKILLSFYDGLSGFYCYALDPADPATALSGSSSTIVTSNGVSYDVCRVTGADQAAYACLRAGGASYEVTTMTAALVRVTSTKARAAGRIAIACLPTGTQLEVIRHNGTTTMYGDLLTTSTLADVSQTTMSAVAAVPQWISCAFRSVQDSGAYRCYAFWDEGVGPALPSTAPLSPYSGSHSYGTNVFSSWVDTAGAVSASAQFVALVAINSRAFDYDGQVYLWLGFALSASIIEYSVPSSTLNVNTYSPQSSYFLYRDDGLLCAKSAMLSAGGSPTSAGWLPGVQAVTSTKFSWAGAKRRVIEVVGKDNRQRSDYAAHTPDEISLTFDSNEARRTVRLGRTLYIPAGETLQYDGVQLTEVGFHVLPYVIEAIDGAGSSLTGPYAWKWGQRWDNAGGDVDRGSTPASLTYTPTPPKNAIIYTYPTTVTHKTNRPIAIELWRTELNPTADSSFYRVTSKNPGDVALSSNKYISNDTTGASTINVLDDYSDKTIAVGEQYPLNGGELENLAPPAATIAIATSDRLFVAGVAGDPTRVWYSKLRRDGQVATFNGRLVVGLPSYATAITGLGIVNDTVIAFTATSCYALDGRGYDNVGGGANYGPARLLSTDVGALEHESIASTPIGIFFKSKKGWYLLDRGWSLRYIGGPVSTYDSETIIAVHVVESQHQIRCLSSSRMLVFDFKGIMAGDQPGQWAEWTVANCVGSAMNGGVHHVATVTSVLKQRTDYTGIDYGIEARLAPIKLNDLQGAGSVRWLSVLGEYRGPCRMQVMLYRDYTTSPYQTVTWTPNPAVVGEPMTVSIGPSIPKCTAIAVHIKAISTTTTGPPATEAFRLTGLALDVGVDKGLNRRLPAAQKV